MLKRSNIGHDLLLFLLWALKYWLLSAIAKAQGNKSLTVLVLRAKIYQFKNCNSKIDFKKWLYSNLQIILYVYVLCYKCMDTTLTHGDVYNNSKYRRHSLQQRSSSIKIYLWVQIVFRSPLSVSVLYPGIFMSAWVFLL